jgi:hypothetical protein
LILIKGSRGMKMETLVEFIWDSSSVRRGGPRSYPSMFTSQVRG